MRLLTCKLTSCHGNGLGMGKTWLHVSVLDQNIGNQLIRSRTVKIIDHSSRCIREKNINFGEDSSMFEKRPCHNRVVEFMSMTPIKAFIQDE